jgi:hypothetical protein
MNELQFGNKVRQLLDSGAEPGPATLARLRVARERALARLPAQQEAQGEAWASDVLSRFGGIGGASFRLLLPLAILLVGLSAIYGWQQNVRVAEVEEVDAQLLAEDLPIDAYLDRGFQTWLKKRAAEE